MLLAVFVLGSAFTRPAQASPFDPSAPCRTAIQQASQDTGVPLGALLSIIPPTPDNLDHWPWTISVDGNRIWFDTEEQARFHIWQQFRGGRLTFGIGCFQLGYRQHGQAFDTIEAMFDPRENAQVAARALARLKAQLGDWQSAVAAFRLQNRAGFPEGPATVRIARGGGGLRHTVILDRLPQVGRAEPERIGSEISQRKTLAKNGLGTSNGS